MGRKSGEAVQNVPVLERLVDCAIPNLERHAAKIINTKCRSGIKSIAKNLAVLKVT